jgi:NhaP-type Na+/H+ or K+/H+ antiporter
MAESVLISLASIIILGMFAQWLAWRINVPSILLLLLFGISAGPLTGIIRPQETLGNAMFPIITLSVAIILFEGGLSLRVRELREVGRAFRNLVSIGLLITWVLTTAGAYTLLDLDFKLAVLLGSILVVTGPTVILPLLRHMNVNSRMSAIAKWEGIINDPIGALVAVLVFESILVGNVAQATTMAIAGIFKTIFLGLILGFSGAVLLLIFMRRYWIPDHLQNPVTLMLVFFVFVLCNHFQPESGLFGVTVMGIVMANQNYVSIKHIIEFKENLRVLLISTLFIILSARLEMSDINVIDASAFLFLTVLVVIVRPVAVFLSTISTGLNWREKIFLAVMAPRGIVAAAVASVFTIELADSGYTEAYVLMPYIFFIIIGTVVLYGLGAPAIAKWLHLSEVNPQGILLIGAHPLGRAFAKVIQENGFKVLLVDRNRAHVTRAKMAGLSAHHGDVLVENIFDELDLSGLGRLLAITPNDEVNNLASLHFMEIFGRREVYQLAVSGEAQKSTSVSAHLRGRVLFNQKITYEVLSGKFEQGAKIKATPLTESFTIDAFRKQYGQKAIPLCKLIPGKELTVFATDSRLSADQGQIIVSLIAAE